MTNKNKKLALIASVLLASFILVGTYSPDWAPLEHPDFETAATIHPFHVYLEAETITPLIPKRATLYRDYDLPIGGGLYKPIRKVILQLFIGVDPTQFARPPITLYGVREERFSQGIAQDWDIVYSSGYHRLIAVQFD